MQRTTMPGIVPAEDPWLRQQIIVTELSELDGCSIVVDAKYFIQMMLQTGPNREPLMAAIGGVTSFQKKLEKELDKWAANNITPLFIFDGQTLVGQDEVSIETGLRNISKTDNAWKLYFSYRVGDAVPAFLLGCNYRLQTLFPLMQRVLKARNLHFLTPPYNASGQIAYFDTADSDQCAGIMGSQEMLLYPIHDSVIRGIAWGSKKVFSVSKRQIIRSLNVNETLFVDAFLMTGTMFLPSFPPLRDSATYPRQPTVVDAMNMLRTADKNVANLCATFNDVLQAQDPNWLDKFRKARMIVDHFIYIAESGEVLVHDADKLTKDNHLYLGFQLPAELFHYLNTGLVGPAVLSWITHCSITILPTLDGFVSDEYRNLVSKQLIPYYETALGLVVPRLNRGLQFQDVEVKVWYDPSFSRKINHRNEGISAASRVEKWNITKELLDKHFPGADCGSIAFEVAALANKEFVAETLQAPKTEGIDSEDAIVSLTLWKLLTLNGYIDKETLTLTPWGAALAKTLSALGPLKDKAPDMLAIYHAALLAYELAKLGLLTTGHKHDELQGWPMNGTEEDMKSVLLISRVGMLLQLRQDDMGYTGPLSNSLLAYHSLSNAVGDANRNVIEALLISTFVSRQAKREGLDNWAISHRLPFYEFPDAALSIAVKTYLDESTYDDTEGLQEARRKNFVPLFVPHSLQLFDDMALVFGLVAALQEGMATLTDKEMPADARADWDKAKQYLDNRK